MEAFIWPPKWRLVSYKSSSESLSCCSWDWQHLKTSTRSCSYYQVIYYCKGHGVHTVFTCQRSALTSKQRGILSSTLVYSFLIVVIRECYMLELYILVSKSRCSDCIQIPEVLASWWCCLCLCADLNPLLTNRIQEASLQLQTRHRRAGWVNTLLQGCWQECEVKIR